jgi:NAD(P)H-dependent flavin oxidoreductase YrpB (nitropropane dioxygenase family)
MSLLDTPLTRQLGIEVPLICGAMYPCTNPELVAAVSAAGGIGVVQPLSMIYVYGHDLREGLRLIRRTTDKPIGMNVLIERSSKLYLERMHHYVDVALEEGVRFFVTSLGKPRCRRNGLPTACPARRYRAPTDRATGAGSARRRPTNRGASPVEAA